MRFVEPRIPGTSTIENSRHVSYCCSRLNQTPKLVPRAACHFPSKLCPSHGPTGVWSGDRGGHETGPFRHMQRCGWWVSKNYFRSRVKWAVVPSCINHIVCRVANGPVYPLVVEVILPLINVNKRPLRVKAVALSPMKRSPIIPAQTSIVNWCLVAA
jgi:hypothetical protein